ncbi:hypothetical protein HNQ59_001137 [Chitinivorax tropicus]|uniref:Uncharacterized protein n=1 Tax=Chitinivorax tropicus TaxID=714531 RepID=A0A840MLT8_9PROT|nr:hypothetical protein [Chitinivorax tropicus]MBB5017867.1 hypothetical protein [Chitinivorax tropicus]
MAERLPVSDGLTTGGAWNAVHHSGKPTRQPTYLCGLAFDISTQAALVRESGYSETMLTP